MSNLGYERTLPVSIPFVNSQAVIASGVSATFDVGGFSEILMFLGVTAVSGTTPTLSLFVDTSSDGGTTWYQLATLGPASITAVPSSNPYASTATLSLGRIVGSTAFGDKLRIRYTVGGTTPSFTISVRGIAK